MTITDDRTAAAPQQRTQKRRDIQGLRAVAVAVVMVYHFFPTVLPGGFVGVDVFLVISGYLITLLLLREIDRTGTLRLPRFYLRRVRRLMPAALTVSAATVVAAIVIVDPVRLVSVLQDAAWTSAYLANVHFGMDPAGYFATSEPSPFLHFWSLAVEEQFYLVWPALLLIILAIGRHRFAVALPIVLAAIIGGSLIASHTLTVAESSHAYYSLGTRAWELAIGGVVAYLVFRQATAPSRAIAVVSGAVGSAAVLYAVIAFSQSTLFPGTAALIPTLGTALIIWAGTGWNGPLTGALSVRPAQIIGDASYSLYLWHWPVLILGRAILGDTRQDRLLLLVLAGALGLASYYVIEVPTGRVGHHWRSWRALGVSLVIAAVAVAVPAAGAAHVPVTGGGSAAEADAARATVDLVDGELRVALERPVTPPVGVPSNVTPSLAALPDDLAEVFTNGCFALGLIICEGGDPAGQTKVVLAGDSHAGQWWPALDQAATDRGWKLYLVGKNGCALADVRISRAATPDAWPECDTWQREAVKAIVDLDADVILYANHAQGYSAKASLIDDFANRWNDGVTRTLSELTRTSPVIVFGQSPVLSQDPATCLSAHLSDVAACTTALDVAVRPDVAELAPALASAAGSLYFDPTTLLCPAGCPIVDQNTVMYRDVGHLSRTYSQLLAEPLALIVEAALQDH